MSASLAATGRPPACSEAEPRVQVIGSVAALNAACFDRARGGDDLSDERVSTVGRDGPVGAAGGSRDRGAHASVLVAAKPDVGESARLRRPQAVVDRQLAACPRRARDRGRRGRRQRRGGRGDRPDEARVGDLAAGRVADLQRQPDRVADVLRDGRVVRRRRPRDQRAGSAGEIAAVPLVGEDDRPDALPDPGRRDEDLSDLRRAGDRRADRRGRPLDRAVDHRRGRGAERVLDDRAVRRLHDGEERVTEVGAPRSCRDSRWRAGSRRTHGRSSCSAPTHR